MTARAALRLVPAVPDDPWSPSLLDRPVVLPLDRPGAAARTDDLGAHLATYGPREAADPRTSDALLDLLAEVGATGRGGGHFPAHRKWRAVRDTTRRTGVLPVVVANGAEGEPASGKDAALLTRRPHLVLDGLADAAETLGATESVVWLHGDAVPQRAALDQALRERRAAGTTEPPVRVLHGPAHYLTGESSAAVRALSGGPALPEHRRHPAAVEGVGGRPTLLNNVETLARVALLRRTGASGHRPTTLVTVVAEGARTVLEVDATSTVAEVVPGPRPQAVLVGGYGGSWLPWSEAAALALDETVLRAAGASLGAGILAPLPPGACGIAETARVAGYLAGSSARQCGPCLFGLPAVAGVVADLHRGRARRRDLDRLRRWAAEVRGRGACHHPDGAVRLVLSALTTFADDVEAHRRGRPCPGADAPGLLPVPAVRP